MNKGLSRYFFLASLLVHVGVFVLVSYLANLDNTIHKKFLVLGAHSREQARAVYKSSRTPVPFTGSGKTNALASSLRRPRGRLEGRARSKARQQAAAAKKRKAAAVKAAQVKKAQQVAAKQKAKQLQADKKARVAELRKKKAQEKEAKLKQKKKPKPEAKAAVPVKPQEPEVEPEEVETPPVIEPEPAEQPSQTSETAENEADADSDEEEVINLSEDHSGNERLLLYQKLVSMEVERVWQPPVGVKKGTEATGLFTISKDGKVASFEFEKKSGIIIYDLSIVRIAQQLTFEEQLWGKKFVVGFRQ